jgi:hypothetical protein
MPAMVSVNLGDPEFEQVVRSRVQQFMESYEGHWMIRVLGSQQSPIWHLKVEAPDGTKEWVTTLYGEKISHSIDKILIELQKIVEKKP